MKPFLYLLRRNSINYLKSIKHKPSKAVPLIFFLFFIVIMTLSVVLNDETGNDYSNPNTFIGICTIASFLLLLFIIHSGISRKNFKYTIYLTNKISNHFVIWFYKGNFSSICFWIFFNFSSS